MPDPDDRQIRQVADLAYATAFRTLGDAQDAADCAQEVLVEWWTQRTRIRASILGWV
jgi:DNA-directed RNA polymerase specialized sigma24 family protein